MPDILTAVLLQGVLPPGNAKADPVRKAFYASRRRCIRSIDSIIILQNSDSSLSVRNPLDGNVYSVIKTPTVDLGDVVSVEYEFECLGVDSYGGRI